MRELGGCELREAAEAKDALPSKYLTYSTAGHCENLKSLAPCRSQGESPDHRQRGLRRRDTECGPSPAGGNMHDSRACSCEGQYAGCFVARASNFQQLRMLQDVRSAVVIGPGVDDLNRQPSVKVCPKNAS